MDQGPNVFVSQFTNIDNMRDKKEAITFVTNQLINFREFSDKLHFFLKESLELLKIEDIKEIQIFLGKYFRHVFNSQTLNLWIPDGVYLFILFLYSHYTDNWYYLHNGCERK